MEKKKDMYQWASEKLRLVDGNGRSLHCAQQPTQDQSTRLMMCETEDCSIRILDMAGFDYTLAEYTVSPQADTVVGVTSNTPVLMFFIFLQGNAMLRHESVYMQRLQWNVTYRPWLNDALLFKKGERYRIVVIHFELLYLMQWKDTHQALDRFFDHSVRQRAVWLYARHHPPAPLKMLASLTRITLDSGGYTDQMFREVRVLEVLFHAVESLFREQPPRRRELHDADVVKITQAYGYMLDHLDKAITLQHLTQTFGINVRKLKLGFPYVYGVTFYTLLTAARMEHAGLLLERGHTTREVCSQIGYRSASHFAQAYRKHFGYAPERRRRN